jgi:hypothetical protein
MSKLIRSTTVVRRTGKRTPKKPLYIIATGGEVYIAKWVGKTLTWIEASEADFPVRLAPAANEEDTGTTDKA